MKRASKKKRFFILFAAIMIVGLAAILRLSDIQGSQTNSEFSSIYHEFVVQQFYPEAPLPSEPEGQLTIRTLGDITVEYFSTAIIRGDSESGTDFFIELRNGGSKDVKVNVPSKDDLASQVPEWNKHFFSFQNSSVIVPAGDEYELWYYASLEDSTDTFTVTFRLSLDSGEYVDLPVIFGKTDESFEKTSLVYGYITDTEGNPITEARIDVQMNCGRLSYSGDIDGKGTYSVAVPAKEDINAIYGVKELACGSTDYFMTVAKDGYELFYRDGILPSRESLSYFNITLTKSSDSETYAKRWERKVDDNYGFFWVKPSEDWSVFAAAQSKHPPELGLPSNFYMFNSNGEMLWKFPTGNECWGIDISSDGKVVAGCSDGNVYLVDESGDMTWRWNAGDGMIVRTVCFSDDGSRILTGTVKHVYLFSTGSNESKDIPWADEWIRNCAFFGDSFVVGSTIVGWFDSGANKVWEYNMGEFPLFMGTDQYGNTFAGGKSRTLFSFSKGGTLMWKTRIPDHTITTGAMTPDGSRILIGTIGGMVYLFDGNGNLLWKRATLEQGGGDIIGHNAADISPDGSRIVVGTAPNNCIIVYNGNGTVLWKTCDTVEKDSSDLIEGVTNVHISSDKSKIIASYGDNFIRMFEL